MRTFARQRRTIALLGAATLHGLLAVLVVSRGEAPLPPEAPAMQVTLLDLPRQRREPMPPLTSPELPLRASGPSVVAPARGDPAPPAPRPSAALAGDWRVDTSEPPGGGAVRGTLRAHLGCRTADLLALTKAERAACQEALAKGAETAPTYAVVSPKLRKVFEGTFECPKGDVWCEYRIGKAPYPGLLAPRKAPRDPTWDP